MRPIGLLVIGRKMLGRDSYPITLYTVDHRRSGKSYQERILRVILEVAPTERMTHQVHARTEKHVTAVFQDFVTHGLSYLIDEISIPGGSEQRTDGESRAVIGIGVIVSLGIDTQSGRTICQDCVGNTKTVNLCGKAGCSGNNGITLRGTVSWKACIRLTKLESYE